MLSNNYRLKPASDIGKVKKEGKPTKARLFTILALDRKDQENSRFAFIISSKVSNKAVLRNKIKRSLSEGIRHNIAFLKKGFDVVIIAKPTATKAYTDEIIKEVKSGLKKANLLSK